MCGIAGYFGKELISQDLINKTLAGMRNRGPDFASHYEDKFSNNLGIYMLHSRLSIIDLHKRSNQPFVIGDYILVYNGEIYNYLELKKNLESKKIYLKTNSDTEILLNYYMLYGEKCVDYFDGMWSFAIFNKKTKNLFISRDRFAEKPLYYFIDNGGIYFGSEVKFIRNLYKKQFKINKKKINTYLSFGARSVFKDNDSFYEGIRQLASSENLSCDSRLSIKIKKYWQPNPKINYKITEKEAISTTRELLIKSLKLRMRADVPSAFCLSGGVDSGGLASIAAKELNLQIKTYSIVDGSDPRYNEQVSINKVIKDIDCESEILPISTDNFIFKLRKLVEYHDSPVWAISQYLHYNLMQLIRNDGYKVAICGNGADELFSGYYDHYLLHLQSTKSLSSYKEHLKYWEKHVEKKIRNPVLKNKNLFVDDPSYRGYVYDHSEILKKYFVNPENFNFTEDKFSNDLFSNRRMNEMFGEVIPAILNNEDLNAMMNSIENRAPYLNKELFDFCFSLPPEILINKGYAKYILRESLKGILHEDVRMLREKRGFNCSIKTLIDFKDKETLDYLLEKKSDIFEFIDRDKFSNIFKEDLTKNHFSKFIFSFLSVKLFLDQKQN